MILKSLFSSRLITSPMIPRETPSGLTIASVLSIMTSSFLYSNRVEGGITNANWQVNGHLLQLTSKAPPFIILDIKQTGLYY
jgi:hypothetical protein